MINMLEYVRFYLLILVFAIGVVVGGSVALYLALLQSVRTKNHCCRPSYAANRVPPNDLVWRSKLSELHLSQCHLQAEDSRFFHGFSLN
ncbi:MAG: hypothetical protein CMR00_06740 [[Chlorobium] sp. 445]|nr:MAG: hypothetical protein CMR00_06740 [[Chlorobium] sp. 445]